MKRVILSVILILSGICAILYSKDILKTGFPMKYEMFVSSGSVQFNFDKYLAYSVMRAESKYDRTAVSYAGAKGLMQITDDTFKMIRQKINIGNDVFDAETNITAGIWYLSFLYNKLNNIRDTVRAYNCGLNNLDLKIAQTEIFTKRVFEFYDIYTHLYLD